MRPLCLAIIVLLLLGLILGVQMALATGVFSLPGGRSRNKANEGFTEVTPGDQEVEVELSSEELFTLPIMTSDGNPLGLSQAVDCPAVREAVECLRQENTSKTLWVMFIGDSNMRHTYVWWVSVLQLQAVRSEVSQQFGMDRRDLGYGGRWCDQEAVLNFKDGSEVRLSLRFISSGFKQLTHVFDHWHDSYLAAPCQDKRVKCKLPIISNSSVGSAGGPRPSEFALWATRVHKLIDYSKQDPALHVLLQKYQHLEPSAVILTEAAKLSTRY